jgi:hypothetical protein|tara:strand:+ start:278 stop:556 length:279 start_codon:yes stop_codon:yes gene_type:complete
MNTINLKTTEEAKCFKSLCQQLPLLVIKTQCGLGKYEFSSIGVNDSSKLIIKYRLINDNDFKDNEKIAYYLGDYCYFNAEQFLYACKYYAIS